MKRLCTSDSPLGGLMSICPTSSADEEIQGSNNHVYSREFQSMLEGLDEEESGHINVGGKKRRLSVDQVKALERNFEVENKLEPERKVKLAQELGLQPRQVAVWFQNRRARWKTKQLERDYGILKANFDALKHNFDNLQHDNQALHKEIYELKSKLEDDKGGDIKVSVLKEEEEEKEEEALMVPPIGGVLCNNNNNNNDKAKSPPLDDNDDDDDMLISEFDDEDEVIRREVNFEIFNSNKNGLIIGAASIFKDAVVGSSDSDSSAIFNEENNNNKNSCSPNASNGGGRREGILDFQFSDTKGGGGASAAILGDAHKSYLSQFVKIEEHNFFSETCTTFFSDDQPPTLHWDCPPDQPWKWN